MTENEKEREEKEDKTDEQIEESEQQDKNDYSAAIAEIRAEYEAKIAREAEEHKKKLDERDAVIRQLLVNGQSPKSEDFIEKINQKRKYKKW